MERVLCVSLEKSKLSGDYIPRRTIKGLKPIFNDFWNVTNFRCSLSLSLCIMLAGVRKHLLTVNNKSIEI